MKNTISNYLLVLIFLATGCSSSKKSTVESSQENCYEITFNNLPKGKSLEKNKRLSVNVKANAAENRKYKKLIDYHFKELEKLELGFAKIYYDKKDAVNYDCEIEILFDELKISDEESINNKSFTKKVRDEAVTADETDTYQTVAVVGYVRQTKKIRKLNWDIVMKVNSDFNYCKSTNISSVESFVSKSVDYSLSGDERAISRKYKEPIGEPLLSKKEMIIGAINQVYKKVEDQLSSNQ